MAKIYYDQDADLANLQGKTICIKEHKNIFIFDGV